MAYSSKFDTVNHEYKTICEACALQIEDKNIYFDERSGNQFDIR